MNNRTKWWFDFFSVLAIIASASAVFYFLRFLNIHLDVLSLGLIGVLILGTFYFYYQSINLRKKNEEIKKMTVLQRAILTEASYAIIVTDLKGIVTVFNPAAERMLGYDAREIVGKKTPAVWHDAEEVHARAKEWLKDPNKKYTIDYERKDFSSSFELFAAAEDSYFSEQQEWIFLKKNGSAIKVMLGIAALRDHGGVINGYLGIAIDITAHKKNQLDLLNARDQLKKAADVAELGIWSWRFSDNMLTWNEQMFALYGQSQWMKSEPVHYDFWKSYIDPEDLERFTRGIENAKKGIEHFNMVFRIILPEGKIRYIQSAAEVERDSNGDPIQLTGFSRDVTAQYEYENALRLAKERSDAANKAKSDFVANVSHEVRTPMNAIIGMLQLLAQSNLDRQQKDYAKKAELSARSLLQIINNVLDFSKIEAEKLKLDLVGFQLTALLNEIAIIISANLSSKNIECLFDVEPGLPDHYIGDAIRLKQVLLNLCSNAIKFTEKGVVVLEIKKIFHLNKIISLSFSVRDTGIGIAADKLDKIFESFSQAEVSTTRRFGGTGLGLAICHRLIKLMGGNLSVSSEVGKGSIFSFHVELGCQDDNQNQKHGITNKGYHAILVSKNMIFIDNIKKMFAAAGAELEVYMSEDTIEHMALLLNERDIDFVLLDCNSLENNGILLAKKIKFFLGKKRTMVIGVTNFHIYEDKVFDWLLFKPIIFEMFDNLTKNHYETSGKKTANRLEGYRVLLVEDNPTNQLVAYDLLKNEHAKVDVVSSGEEAILAVKSVDPLYHVVLMDIQMPDMDGYMATAAIRQIYDEKQLPIIAMTANVSVEDWRLAVQAGMNVCLGKPFDVETLVTQIEKCVTVEVKDILTDTLLNVDNAITRFGGNQAVYCRALMQFLKDIKKLMGDLANLSLNDEDKIAKNLHSMKGVASTVGAEKVYALSERYYQKMHDRQCNVHVWLAGRDKINLAIKETIVFIEKWLQENEVSEKADINFEKKGRPKILIVDDQKTNIELSENIFSSEYEVLLANSANEALNMCEKTLPDLILLDVVMPEVDGLTLCKILKNQPETADIPVMFVTGYQNPEEESSCWAVGGVDFVNRPVNTETLKQRVKVHLMLKLQTDRLKEMAMMDSLTGIPNRRLFEDRLQVEIRQTNRTGMPLSILMIDVDFFKRYNDHYGHLMGDECLKQIATALKANVKRPRDLIARYGGEEFVCLLPETDEIGARAIAEKLVLGIRQLEREHLDSDVAKIVTVSIGYAVSRQIAHVSAELLIETADAELYRAKQGGRNRVSG